MLRRKDFNLNGDAQEKGSPIKATLYSCGWTCIAAGLFCRRIQHHWGRQD